MQWLVITADMSCFFFSFFFNSLPSSLICEIPLLSGLALAAAALLPTVLEELLRLRWADDVVDEDLTTGNTKFQCCSLLRLEAAWRCTCNPSLREKNDSLIPSTKDGFPCTQIWPSLEISNFWEFSVLAWIISAPALRLPVKHLHH